MFKRGISSLLGSLYQLFNSHEIVKTWYRFCQVLDLKVTILNWRPESTWNLSLLGQLNPSPFLPTEVSQICTCFVLVFIFFPEHHHLFLIGLYSLNVLKNEQILSLKIMQENIGALWFSQGVAGGSGGTTGPYLWPTPEVLCLHLYSDVSYLDFISFVVLVLNVSRSATFLYVRSD